MGVISGGRGALMSYCMASFEASQQQYAVGPVPPGIEALKDWHLLEKKTCTCVHPVQLVSASYYL
jgi:hypothetical protein